MSEQIQIIFESLKIYWNQLLEFLPKLFIGITLLILVWLIAKLFRFVLIKFLKLIRIDSAAERAGIADFLLKGGVQFSTVTILANIIYWLTLLALTFAVLDSLGLKAAKELFNQIIAYSPNIIIAFLVLIFGILFARFLRSTVYTYLTNVNLTGAELISNSCYWIILLIVFFIALHQLSLGSQLLIYVFEVAFAGLCLAFAISFGLAGKEWATQILEKIWRKTR